MITEEIKFSNYTFTWSGFAEFRTGTYTGHIVAAKIVRVTARDDFLKARKVSVNDIVLDTWGAALTILSQKFCKEIVLWNTLSHPNVLKLAGVQMDMDRGKFTTVSEWMPHGNIVEYIEKNYANRLELVRDFTVSTAFTEMQQTVAWGSSWSEVSPRCQSVPWKSQRGRYPFVS